MGYSCPQKSTKVYLFNNMWNKAKLRKSMKYAVA